jgi:integrase
MLALLSRLFTLAERWEWRTAGSNPCRLIERFSEVSRERFLKLDELTAIGDAMTALSAKEEITRNTVVAIQLLLLTGARLNEVLSAEWSWVDLEKGVIALPDSKTGKKPLFLGDAAVAVLQKQRHRNREINSPFVLPGRHRGKHMINLSKPWRLICKTAGLSNVRLHDLRHTAASVAVGQGASLALIGRLLGHSQAQTTQRYAHVDIDPALAVANSIGNAIGGAIGAGRRSVGTEEPPL